MKRTMVSLAAGILLTALLLSATPARTSAGDWTTGVYVVRMDDTLASIAARFCTNWQDLYSLNASTMASPNQIYPGMQLRVINRCGGGSGWPGGGWSGYGGVYDRGPRLHAQGYVYGNTYVVAAGDTSFSIAQRFGISVQALGSANGIDPWRIYAGCRLVIPGLGGYTYPKPPVYPTYPPPPVYQTYPPPPLPTVLPIPITPAPTAPPPLLVYLTIDSPTSGAVLEPMFTVSGQGRGLFEGHLVVRAQTSTGQLLDETVAVLQGTDVGAGAPGVYSAQLTVDVDIPTAGWIIAYSPQTPAVAPVGVQVVFSPGAGDEIAYRDFTDEECVVTVRAGSNYYAEINGAVAGTFTAEANHIAVRGAKVGAEFWYLVPLAEPVAAEVWAPDGSIRFIYTTCRW